MELESLYYRLTVPDAAARERLLAAFAHEADGAAVLHRETAAFAAYGSAAQPLFSRLPIPYRVVPQSARTALLRALYRRAERRIGDAAWPRWPVERSLDDARASAWAHAAARGGIVARTPAWPGGRAPLLITHDIDSAADLSRIAPIRALEREIGVASSFGFVPRLSWPARAAVEALVDEGCEVYLHDIGHDGRLPYAGPAAIAAAFDAVFREHAWARPLMCGFRAGQLLTSPALRRVVADWFDYDLSIPDTERGGPYGDAAGCGTVFPFLDGSLVEIPLTLPQDVYLRHVYGLTAGQALEMWRRKLDHIVSVGGVAVLNVHPVWVNPARPDMWQAYRTFLAEARADARLWITTPSSVVAALHALGDAVRTDADAGVDTGVDMPHAAAG